jgi:hypothetical protein
MTFRATTDELRRSELAPRGRSMFGRIEDFDGMTEPDWAPSGERFARPMAQSANAVERTPFQENLVSEVRREQWADDACLQHQKSCYLECYWRVTPGTSRRAPRLH